MRLAHRLPVGLIALALACGESDAEPGSQGGECRINLEAPCNEGLVCDGLCVPADGVEAPLELSAEVALESTVVDAAGASRVRFSLTVLRAPDFEPHGGGSVWVWSDPPAAGQVSPTILELDDEGRGVGAFTACRAEDLGCPSTTVLKTAPADRPLETAGYSEPITLVGGGTAEGGGGGGFGGGTVSLPPQLAEDCGADATGGIIVFKGSDVVFQGPLYPTDRTSGCVASGCGTQWAANIDDNFEDRRFFLVQALSNDTEAPFLGCLSDDVRAGSFAVPEHSGLYLDVPDVGEWACTASAPPTPGTGAGSVQQAVGCEMNLVKEFRATWDLRCNRVRTNSRRRVVEVFEEVRVQGCIKTDRL